MTNILGAQQDARIVVIEQSPANIELLISGQPSVVEVITQGPQGATGGGATRLADLTDVDVASALTGSALLYDSAAGKWIGAPSTTTEEILNGGNF